MRLCRVCMDEQYLLWLTRRTRSKMECRPFLHSRCTKIALPPDDKLSHSQYLESEVHHHNQSNKLSSIQWKYSFISLSPFTQLYCQGASAAGSPAGSVEGFPGEQLLKALRSPTANYLCSVEGFWVSVTRTEASRVCHIFFHLKPNWFCSFWFVALTRPAFYGSDDGSHEKQCDTVCGENCPLNNVLIDVIQLSN